MIWFVWYRVESDEIFDLDEYESHLLLARLNLHNSEAFILLGEL